MAVENRLIRADFLGPQRDDDMKYSQRLIRIFVLMIILASALLPGGSMITAQAAASPQPIRQANQQAEPAWSMPTNLSHSGGTSKPYIFIDSTGVTHALWNDNFASLVYSKSEDGTTWTNPVSLALPFSKYTYRLVVSAKDKVYAFWIDESDRLMVSSVDAHFIGDAGNWDVQYAIRKDTFWFDASVDQDGNLHVLYLLAIDSSLTPSGIYYISSTRDAKSWTEPRLVYASQYFRTLKVTSGPRSLVTTVEDPSEQIDIKAMSYNGQKVLLAAWTNPSIKRVFYTRSLDNGLTWQETAVVDGPGSLSPYLSAEKLHLYISGTNVLRSWRATESGGLCTQKFQSSQDGGETWSQPGVVLGDYTTCADSMEMFPLPDNLTLALISTQSKMYMLAWNGQEWSLPKEQAEIGGFVDSNTYGTVKLECQRGAASGTRLTVVGCDTGSGGDIWQSSYDTSQVKQWFIKTTGWSAPSTLNISSPPVTSLAMTGSLQSNIHLVWAQPDTEATSLKSNVYYASWDSQKSLVGPYTIFSQLEGFADQISLAYEKPSDKLLVTWAGGQSGEVNFSWANTGQANSQSGWFPDSLIDSLHPIQHEPKLGISADGTIYALYTVPLNEQRGVYITSSQDGGHQWSEPALIYNAAEDNCEMVEKPSFTVYGSHVLSALWVCSTVPGGIGPLELMASTSFDGGTTWSPAEKVVSGSITWTRVINTYSKIHRMWQEFKDGKTSIWHSVSEDGGETWQTPKNIYSGGGTSTPADLASDGGSQLFLTLITQEDNHSPNLEYLLWDGQNWAPKESVKLSNNSINDITAIAASVASDGYLVVALANYAPQDATGLHPNQITVMDIPVKISEAASGQTTPESQVSPTLEPTAEATQEILPTPTRASMNLQETPSGSSNTGIILAVVVSAIIVLMFVGIRLIVLRTHQF